MKTQPKQLLDSLSLAFVFPDCILQLKMLCDIYFQNISATSDSGKEFAENFGFLLLESAVQTKLDVIKPRDKVYDKMVETLEEKLGMV